MYSFGKIKYTTIIEEGMRSRWSKVSTLFGQKLMHAVNYRKITII